jgi:hypothetical protein
MNDASLTKSAAMPNAANTVNTAVIALPQSAVRPFTSQFRVVLSNTVATGANTKNVTYTVRGSNEANGANSVALRAFTVAGNGTNHPASSREIYLDPEAGVSYLFASALGEANGGDAGDGTFTLKVEA